MESTPPTTTTLNLKLKLKLELLLFLICFFPESLLATDVYFPQEALPTKSGYLPVSPPSSSAIFYAFYEAQKPTSPLSETPLLIWLQGGPGCSSMLGNFYELGPWRVNSPSTSQASDRQNVQHSALNPNPGAWNRHFGLLFLDNPIGVGFSIAASPDEIPKDQRSVAKHLFTAIKKFVGSDPAFNSRPIYITGESYGGKYVPATGYYTLKWNSKLPPMERVNLAGFAIGNGLTDPVTQVATHAVNAYFSGLINEKQRSELESVQKEAIKLTGEKNWAAATDARNRVLSLLHSMTGLATLYDLRRLIPYETELVTAFLNRRETKAAMGVANLTAAWEECSDEVAAALHADVMKSAKFMVEYLVKESRVLLYQGQCDLRDGVVSTEAWVKTMAWEGIKGFMAAERRVWRVDGKLAGYVQRWETLTHAVVLGAGHLVPADQEVNSLSMIEDWVLQRGSFGNASASANANANASYAEVGKHLATNSRAPTL